MGTIRFLPADRPALSLQPARRQSHHAADQDAAPPGPGLSPGHQAFLAAWFRRLGGERAAPGHRGRYAVVRRGAAELGVVAVDAELGLWFVALNGHDPAEECAQVRQIQRDLSGLGFRYSEHGSLASQYFDFVLAAYQSAAGAIATWLATPVGADREDGWQAGDGGRPGAAAVGRGEEVA